MFGKVHPDNDIIRIDHYLRLNVDNTEIVNLLIKADAPKGTIAPPNWNVEFCIPTRDLRYFDKYGNYWDNYIE